MNESLRRVALAMLIGHAITLGQAPQAPSNRAPAVANTDPPVTTQSKQLTRPAADARHSVPPAQYSPLAAQGGYRGQQMTWYDALFHSLNPANVDWGMKWEQRRTIFLENSVANKYFVYTAALSLMLIYAVIVVIWQRWNHAERLVQLAQRTADALNYAGYWKDNATAATAKHNAHIEKCNRVIEAGESGSPTPDAAEASELRHQIEGMRVESLNLTADNKRLRQDLEQKAAMVNDLSARVDEATRKIGRSNQAGKGGENAAQVATLVDRINRLEEALQAVRAENERLKTGASAAQC